ncbi:hypothetical protein [Lactobacillus paragasseri]|uniref:hypothetical protein n=1 Tax=Lactobacillus paragasseri TaxID=2107999 RepID=UPI00217D558A|nr:hypothetical protein [Lactobacillus paragasseri]UWI43578.1 hypothetical protein HR119_05015 [Lactobacillus paragasseri]UWI44821.1 hypothetical protein HR117_02295 [Lactobacillus paragasseri]
MKKDIKCYINLYDSTKVKTIVGKATNFLNTPEALQGKKEVENGNIKKIGSLDDLDECIKNL